MATLQQTKPLETDNKALNIVHFSDVSDIHTASRFLSALNVFRAQNLDPLVFFSGNFISQSEISCISRGEHMINIMNNIGITCATLGHHDLDFGENNLYNIIKGLTFPIINTNLLFNALPLDPNTNDPLIPKHFIINYRNNNEKSDEIIENTDNIETEETNPNDPITTESKDGLKIGVIGVCENWLHLVQDRLDRKQNIQYMDMIETTQKYIDKLRQEHNVDMIIALTHSKLLNDRVLADKINGIDLILSGRDHLQTSAMTHHTRTLIVKSGANFNQFSWIQFMIKEQQNTVDVMDNVYAHNVANTLKECLLEEKGLFKARKYWYRVRYYQLNDTLKEDETMTNMVNTIQRDYNEHQLDETLVEIGCNLDCTEFALLNGECNSANFVSDIIRVSCSSDCVILSATSFLPSNETIEQEQEQKTDELKMDDTPFNLLSDASMSNFHIDGHLNRGAITYKDILQKVFCDDKPIILLKLTGAQIRRAIEHGLSKNEDIERNELINGVNKWPHVSGLRFVYDPMEQNGNKIRRIWTQRGKYVDLVDDAIYSVATSYSLANGADGYNIFEDPVSIERDDKESINGQMIVIDFLRKINDLNKLKLVTASGSVTVNKRANRREIESRINSLSLRSKALTSCVETKWVSSFQVITRQNTEDGNDDDDKDIKEEKDNKGGATDDDNVELMFEDQMKSKMKENENDAINKPDLGDNSSNSANVELGGGVMDDKDENGNENENENETENEVKEEDENKKNENENETETEQDLNKKSVNLSLKEKWKNIDKEGMRQKLEDIRKSSKVKLELMGQKLKKIAIESQNEMEKLSERAKQFINKDKEIKYDENGNILDVEIFIVKPKIDYRVMTVDDEKRWLKLRDEVTDIDGNTLYVKEEVVIDNHSINANDNDKRRKTSDEMENMEQNKQRRPSLAKLLFVSRSKSSEILKKIENIEFKKPTFTKKKSTPKINENDDVNNDNDNNQDINENADKKKSIFQFKGFNK